MAKTNWDKIAQREFDEMKQTYQDDDWQELYDRVN